MQRVLKILNPFIWILNYLDYTAHLEGQRGCSRYEPYDFAREIPYF